MENHTEELGQGGLDFS